jgi:hypothetical protein
MDQDIRERLVKARVRSDFSHQRSFKEPEIGLEEDQDK